MMMMMTMTQNIIYGCLSKYMLHKISAYIKWTIKCNQLWTVPRARIDRRDELITTHNNIDNEI